MLLIRIPPSIKAGSSNPKIPTRFAGIADPLGMLKHSQFTLDVSFFVRHENFLHPKLGNLQEVSRESVHIYTKRSSTIIWLGGVARTSTLALNNSTLPYSIALANYGTDALLSHPHLLHGLNVHQGMITYEAVSKAQNLNYVSAEEALRS